MRGVKLPGRLFAARSWVAGAALLALVGCGPSYGDLAGKVTFTDGQGKEKPVRMGTIVVTASDGSTLTGAIGDDGAYAIPNVPAGTAYIAVTSQNPKSVVVATRKEKGAPKPEVQLGDATKWFAIPDKYSDSRSSDLSTTIKSGQNEYPINLKDK